MAGLATEKAALDGRLRNRFDRDGFLIFDPELPGDLIDAVLREHQRFWSGGKRVQAMPQVIDPGRTQDAWAVSDPIRALALNAGLLDIVAELYGCRPRPFQTLNFPRGTQQMAHSDSIHFNCEPFGQMCGVWVALEDVGPDQGPLVYYPGSHKLPFVDFHDIGLEAAPTSYRHYEQHIKELIRSQEMRPEYGCLRRGQAIIWHANLLHGGAPQNDPQATRHSQVTHIYMDGSRPWRPMHSEGQRHYFQPIWIDGPFARSRVAWQSFKLRTIRRLAKNPIRP